MEFVDTITTFLISFYSRPPLKIWFICMIIGLAIERIFYAEKGQPLKNIFFNVRYSLVYLLAIFLLAGKIGGITGTVTGFLGIGYINLNVFTQGEIFHEILAALLFLFLLDFFYYWWHRLQHQFSMLWDQHIFHHTEISLNVTTNIRHHWSEFIFQAFVISIPMAVFFNMTAITIFAISSILSAAPFFIHPQHKAWTREGILVDCWASGSSHSS